MSHNTFRRVTSSFFQEFLLSTFSLSSCKLNSRHSTSATHQVNMPFTARLSKRLIEDVTSPTRSYKECKRVLAHELEDGIYNIREDVFCGWKRSLALRIIDPNVVTIWTPSGCNPPKTSLQGRYLRKKTLDKAVKDPQYGISYCIEFP
jgi:hypothetical protein